MHTRSGCNCFNECICSESWNGKRFWIVLRVDGKSQPGKFKRHPSKEEAEAEAKRLTVQTRDTFMVLETVAGFQPPMEVEPVSFVE